MTVTKDKATVVALGLANAFPLFGLSDSAGPANNASGSGPPARIAF